MFKFAIVVFIIGLELCSSKERFKPEPAELGRYRALKPKRLLFEQFKETKLLTVPGFSGKESEDDNEPPFTPSLECGDEFYNLTKGSFGTITSPNYPRRYLPDLQCEWILESVPGTVIEFTLFDSVTQPWLFAFFDYIKISLDGNWNTYYRFAGDVNYKTPFTLVSKENKISIRFITSSWLNFRGFSLFYVVRNRNKADTNPQVNEFGSVQNNNLVAVCNRRPTTPARTNDKYPQEKDNLKIINGEVAVAHQYPFTVALLIDGQFFCSGTLIDDVNVITAAHCVDGADRIVLIFGLHNMTNPAERYYSRQIRLIEFPDTANHVFVHPHYNPDTAANDIAIIRVQEKVRFTGYVQPIYLPSVYSASTSFYGKDLKSVGWGQYDLASDGISTVLREGRARVISNLDCREEYRGAITGNNICTLTPFIPPVENVTSTQAPEQSQPATSTEAPAAENEEVTSTQAPAENEPTASTDAPVENEPTSATEVPRSRRRLLRQSNVTNEGAEEENTDGATEVEAQPEYISPCFGDAGGPLFAEFKESAEGSKDPAKQECVEAKPNGSNDDDLKSNVACDRPKELARRWYVLVGVVSFGTTVCGEDIPVAYTRVSGYLEWIAYVTGRHG